MSQITDPNGFATSYAYDQQRRTVSRATAGVDVTSYLYQPGAMLNVDALDRHVKRGDSGALTSDPMSLRKTDSHFGHKMHRKQASRSHFRTPFVNVFALSNQSMLRLDGCGFAASRGRKVL